MKKRSTKSLVLLFRAVSILLFYFFLNPAALYSQTDFNQRIKKIDSDIENLRSELAKMERKEGDYFSEIEAIDRQVILLSSKFNLYKAEEKRMNSEIAVREEKINKLKNELYSLRQIYEHQVVSSYLFSHRKNDWLVFDWSAPLESLRRFRYFKIVARHEKKLAAELKATQDQLSAQNKKLRQQQQEKHNLVLEISKQLADLTKIRNEKRSLVRRLRNNKTARLLAIKKLESSKESLLEAIRRSELARKAGKKTGTAEKRWIPLKGNFSKNKGRMNWPVSGKIITKFGKYTDPILKTTLKNTGIDIKADFGKPIRAVYSGRVSLITFMAGYGNTVILEHGGGYYTVYSHLNEIYVAQGETVEAGKTIATVGESGSLTGPKLHFELYAKQKPVNPLTWLRKN